MFVLASWEITNRGIGTYGALYQVYAYKKDKNDKLIRNEIITLDDNLLGMEGYQEGGQHFA